MAKMGQDQLQHQPFALSPMSACPLGDTRVLLPGRLIQGPLKVYLGTSPAQVCRSHETLVAMTQLKIGNTYKTAGFMRFHMRA